MQQPPEGYSLQAYWTSPPSAQTDVTLAEFIEKCLWPVANKYGEQLEVLIDSEKSSVGEGQYIASLSITSGERRVGRLLMNGWAMAYTAFNRNAISLRFAPKENVAELWQHYSPEIFREILKRLMAEEPEAVSRRLNNVLFNEVSKGALLLRETSPDNQRALELIYLVIRATAAAATSAYVQKARDESLKSHEAWTQQAVEAGLSNAQGSNL